MKTITNNTWWWNNLRQSSWTKLLWYYL